MLITDREIVRASAQILKYIIETNRKGTGTINIRTLIKLAIIYLEHFNGAKIDKKLLRKLFHMSRSRNYTVDKQFLNFRIYRQVFDALNGDIEAVLSYKRGQVPGIYYRPN